MKSGPSLFCSVWDPERGNFGILPMIWASGLLSLSSLITGWTFSVGCCCFIHGFGPRWAARFLANILRIMTAVPTVVYGFASVFLLVPLIRNGLGGSGFSWLTASIVLSLLIMPTMVLSMDSAFKTIEAQTSITSAALGFTREQNIAMVVLPASKQWIWSSALLGFGRAAGDTLIPTMLAGNAVQYANTPLDAMRTLTAHIGLVLSSDVGGTAYLSLFVAGGILLFVSISANILFRLMRKKIWMQG
ncbi:MAG: ABC transporter permease subunit [Synergistaceae bacterium]|nr:ABC transporter permease subunit [Synergistaceae bacterium]